MENKNFFNVADYQTKTLSQQYMEASERDAKMDIVERNEKTLNGWIDDMEDVMGEICKILSNMEDYMDMYAYDDNIKDYYERIRKACDIITCVC
jgi:hypothetical protein